MLLSILRSAGAGLLALIVAFGFIIAIEAIGEYRYPFQGGDNPHDMAAMCEHVRGLPTDYFLLGSAGWTLTMFAAAWLATRLGTARHSAHGYVVGGLLLALALFNMVMLRDAYPAIFWVANLLGLPLGILFGTWLGKGPPSIARREEGAAYRRRDRLGDQRIAGDLHDRPHTGAGDRIVGHS